MLTFILSFIFGVLPFKQVLNDTERLCMKDGYFIINWKWSPLTFCEDPGGSNVCYMLNPLETGLRFNNSYVRVYDGHTWVYDLGRCYDNPVPLQR